MLDLLIKILVTIVIVSGAFCFGYFFAVFATHIAMRVACLALVSSMALVALIYLWKENL